MSKVPLLLISDIVDTPAEGPCRAFSLGSEVSAGVPFECGVGDAGLCKKSRVFGAHAVADELHALVAAMLLAVAKAEEDR